MHPLSLGGGGLEGVERPLPWYNISSYSCVSNMFILLGFVLARVCS